MSASSIRVIVLSGELEIGRRDEIQKALALLDGDEAVLVDLELATYADSTTLAALLRLRSEAIASGTRLAVVVTNRQLTRLMQYAGIGKAIALYPTRADALRALTPA